MLDVRSTASQKLVQAGRILLKEGPSIFLDKIRGYLNYHLHNKWNFVYFAIELDKTIRRLPTSGELIVRIANLADLPRIHSELFPEMIGEQEYDKRYFELLGRDGVQCFIAERDNRIVHYSWLFMNVQDSPIWNVPFDRKFLKPGDVFIGPVFTLPYARGFIYPQVLSTVIHYLKEQPHTARLVLFIRGTNLSAVQFYRRIGFNEIDNSGARPLWLRAYHKLSKAGVLKAG